MDTQILYMDSKPKISVVLPTWNRGYIVGNAIASILLQDFEDFELIIVDDGSIDNTEQIVKKFKQDKIRYFRIPKTKNVSQTRNFGNAQAQGELIVVQDSDDTSYPDRLKRIWGKYMETNADVIYHDVYLRIVDGETNSSSLSFKEVGAYDKAKLIHSQYIPGQIAYKRSLWKLIHYEEQMKTCDDLMLLLEFALSGAKFAYIDRPLYEYNFLRDSLNILSEHDGRRAEDTKTIIKLLKERYGYEVTGELRKWSPEKLIKQEFIT